MLVRKLATGVAVVLGAPIVLLLVALRPLLLIRFGTLMSSRIGHFVVDTEVYLARRDVERRSGRIVDVIGCPEPVCNTQVRTMLGRAVAILPGAPVWRGLERACRFWTRGERHSVRIVGGGPYPYFPAAGNHVRFTDEESTRAEELLRGLGIPVGAKWVCIHNRDSAYLTKVAGGENRYHDYRDYPVESLISAAEEMSRRGYYVVRVGSVVAEALLSADPRIIDYANSPLRSDFLDIYLLARGEFYIGNDSGLYCVPWVFGKPVLKANFTIPSLAGLPGNVVIFKRMYDTRQKRMLSLGEIHEAGLWAAAETRLFEEAGIELISNTADEILDAAVEVEERQRGAWCAGNEDAALQDRFWEIFHRYSPAAASRGTDTRVGAAFLRKHADLLR